jgi:putative ABC transport system permease protein
MFTNYFKIAIRNLLRQKAHSFINIAGLAIGMTCSMLILLWVQDELSYDRFNENADRLCRVVETQHYTGGQAFPAAVTPTALAAALKQEIPQIERSTRFAFFSLTMKHGDNSFTEGVAMADPDFLSMFTVRFLQGDPTSALTAPHSMVLTRDAARRYFGDENPMGKILGVENRDNFIVTGVIENIPHNSHLKFELLAPFVYLRESGTSMTDWNSNWCFTYALLQRGASLESVSKSISGFMQQHTKSDTQIDLQALTDIHLYSAGKYAADIGGHGDIQYVRIFFAIALFILLIACVNFMNLATARSARRAKEVGLRKVVGASRSQLIRQFFGEAALLTSIAFLLAFVCTELFLPEFNSIAGKSLSLGHLDLASFAGFLSIALLAGLFSGSYPALVLSAYQPVETIKGTRGSTLRGASIRKVLVVLQFALSVIMVIGTLVVSGQLDYIRHKNLGLNKENLGCVYMYGSIREKHEIAKREMLKVPGVASLTITDQLPTSIVSATAGWDWEGKPAGTKVMMHFVNVDDDYVQTFQMNMAAGRFFSPEYTTDSLAAVVNETAAQAMGMSSPLGKRLTGRGKTFTIIGIVKDFNFAPLQTKIEPLVLLISPPRPFVMVMRLKSDDLSKTIAGIEGVYKKFSPDSPFNFSFLNEEYDQLYLAEEHVEELTGYFTALAIFIAALGLYGLASYTAQQRTKEIGVRKVLGASTPGLFLHLSREFVFLAMLASLLAWPAAYVVMSGWLENYAYHAPLGFGVFVLASGLALVVVFVSVSYQTIRAARANPAEALRYE